MSTIDDYINASSRENTRSSYQSAIRHFEHEWQGLLPATADSIARYLADYAGKLSINTLNHRLAAISSWHVEQGFPDPTKAPIVRKVLRGIRVLHPAQEKRAKPFQLQQLQQVVNWLDSAIQEAQSASDFAGQLKHTRNKSLLLLGFWRGFRGDELTRLRIEHVEVIAQEGMVCYLPYSKNDRHLKGTSFRTPALSILCPVNAYLDWMTLSELSSGPVFRGINRWGHVAQEGLHPDSLIPLLRSLFQQAGIDAAELYSAHSLRRGFATWATANGWDLKQLMEYVGWKNINSAMRYIESADPFRRQHIEQSLSLYALPDQVTLIE